MTKNQNGNVTRVSPENSAARVAMAIVIPLAAALIVGVLTGTLLVQGETTGPTAAAPLFAALAISAWLVGMRLYGLPGMGLRGGRALFAGIGFAVLAWVIMLVARVLPGLPETTLLEDGPAVVQLTLLVEVVAFRSEGAGRAYFYLLLFEAFATQVWAYGVVFRSLADWRGPLAAAVGSGILFGAVAFLLFQESFIPHWSSFIYFLLWGLLYGVIRLRTGSILGVVLIQSLQSFTVWFVLQPPVEIPIEGLQVINLVAAAAYAIIIWRLWPKEEGDFRI